MEKSEGLALFLKTTPFLPWLASPGTCLPEPNNPTVFSPPAWRDARRGMRIPRGRSSAGAVGSPRLPPVHTFAMATQAILVYTDTASKHPRLLIYFLLFVLKTFTGTFLLAQDRRKKKKEKKGKKKKRKEKEKKGKKSRAASTEIQKAASDIFSSLSFFLDSRSTRDFGIKSTGEGEKSI